MDKKLIYTLFALLGVILFPTKLIIELTNPLIVKSLWFLVFYALVSFIMMVVSSKEHLVPKDFSPPKSIPLAFVSLLCCGGCAWGAYSYFQCVKPKDLKAQYYLLTVFCALSSLFFVYVFMAHLSGNNSFKQFQVLLFSVPIMYLCLIAVFFSCEIGKHDMYDFFSKALTLLFYVYYSQNYVSFQDLEYKRHRMVTFGLPSSLVTFGYFFSHLSSFQMSSVQSVTSVMHALISLYTISFLLIGPLKVQRQLEPAS